MQDVESIPGNDTYATSSWPMAWVMPTVHSHAVHRLFTHSGLIWQAPISNRTRSKQIIFMWRRHL
jgi:hypothetical protein